MNLPKQKLRRGRPAGNSRAEIVLQASLLFREHGFQSTGIDLVMASCGKTAGTFYHHFDSKEDLVLAALEKAFEQSQAFLKDYLWDCQDSKSRWKKWSTFYLSPVRLKDVHHGCPILGFTAEVARSEDRVKESFSRLVRELWLFIDGGSRLSSRHYLVFSMMSGSLSIARVLPESRLSMHLSLALQNVHSFIDERWPRDSQ